MVEDEVAGAVGKGDIWVNAGHADIAVGPIPAVPGGGFAGGGGGRTMVGGAAVGTGMLFPVPFSIPVIGICGNCIIIGAMGWSGACA